MQICGKRTFYHKTILKLLNSALFSVKLCSSLVFNQWIMCRNEKSLFGFASHFHGFVIKGPFYAKQSRIKQFISIIHAMTFQVERIYAMLFKWSVLALFEFMPSCGLFTIWLNLQVCLVLTARIFVIYLHLALRSNKTAANCFWQ